MYLMSTRFASDDDNGRSYSQSGFVVHLRLLVDVVTVN